MQSVSLPDLLPDMTLYSLTACAHRMSGATRGSQTSLALFGNQNVGLLHDFPSNLNTFCARTGGAYGDARTVARLTTNLPYFVCFRPPAHQVEFVSMMSSDTYGRFKFRLGLPASPTGGRFPLRACARCIRNDEERYGVAYWHRCHQLPGVYFCQDHEEPLLESHLRLDRRRRSVFVLPKDEGVFEKQTNGCRGDETLIRLASLSADLLDRSADFAYSGERMRAAYIHALRDRGMVTNAGRVRTQELLNWMQSLYGTIAHRPPYDRIFAEERVEGLLRLVRKPRSDFDTLYHAVLIDALFGSWGLFRKTYFWEEQIDHISTVVLSDQENTSLDPKLLELARRANDEDASLSSLCREMDIDFQTALRQLANRGIVNVRRRPKVLTRALRVAIVSSLRRGAPQREVAKRMGVSRTTVDRVCHETPGLHKEWETANFINKRDTERKRLLTYIRLNPTATRMDARQDVGSVYKWLHRLDKQWLEAQPWQAPRRKCGRKQFGRRINWSRRDLECLKALQELAATKTLIEPGERHRPSVIVRKLPYLGFVPRLERLPQSRGFVAALLASKYSSPD